MRLVAKFVGWQGFKPAVEAVQRSLDGVAKPVLNIASALLGLIFVGYLVRAVVRQQAGEPGGQEALFRVAVTMLGGVLLLQVIRLMFFN